MFLLFNGLMLSSLVDLGMPFDMVSGLLSDDCDRFRAFWAEPSMPSRLKFVLRAAAAALSEFGDLSTFAPLGPAVSWGEGISTEKSRLGRGNWRTTLALVAVVIVAVTECGESPLEDGDMLGAVLDCIDCDDEVAGIQIPGPPGVWEARTRCRIPSQSATIQQQCCCFQHGLAAWFGFLYSNATNTKDTRTRRSLSNSHYRAATNETGKPVGGLAGQPELKFSGARCDGASGSAGWLGMERWEASPGSWERKVEDSYVRYPIPHGRGQPVPRRAPGGKSNQATRGRGLWRCMYFRTQLVLCSTTCPPESTFNHSKPGPARVRCGSSAVRCLRMLTPNRWSLRGRSPLAWAIGPGPVTHPSKSQP